MMIDGYRKTEARSKRTARAVILASTGALVIAISVRVMSVSIGGLIFPIKEVRIYGNTFIAGNELLRIMDVDSGKSLLFFNTRAARSRLLADGRVSGAQLLKVWPGTLKVYVAEKERKFQLVRGERRYWLSAEGIVLSQVKAGEEERSPTVTLQSNNDDIDIGKAIGNFLMADALDSLGKIEKRYPEFYRTLSSIAVGAQGVELYVKGKDFRVYLGNSVSEEKLEKLRALLLVLESDGSGEMSPDQIREIDLSLSYAAVRKGEN
jgi:cell division protein FtsQ